MKKAAKLLIPILILCFALLTFTACNDDNTQSEPTNEQNISMPDENKTDITTPDEDSTENTTPDENKPDETITEHSHTYGEWEITKEPTCGEDGVKSRSCTAGDDTQTETIPATGLHTFGDDHICTVCGQEQPPMTEGLIFTLKEDDTYEVTGYYGTEQDVYIRDTYEGKAVTSIRSSAFNGCSSLTSITIPDSVTSIGNSAFYWCRSLTSITIPNSVTSIGDYAFSGCYKLVEVYNKSSLDITKGSVDNGYVGYYAKNVYTEEGVSKLSTDENGYILYTDGEEIFLIGYTGMGTILMLPEGITDIYKYAFCECRSLTSITIPDGVTGMGEYAFSGCRRLTSVMIPDSVTRIGYGAFYGCSSLTSITIPDGVTSIGYEAFRGCSSLTSVTIPDSVTRIGDSAFWDCSSLTSITIPDSVTSIGNWAFNECRSLTSITIPDSVRSIGNKTFYNCTSLTDITIPDSVTSIEYHAFYGCSSLTSITIGNSVTSVGDSAFYGCTGLTSVYYTGDIASWCGILFVYSSSNPLYYAHNLYINNELVTEIVIPDTVTEIKAYAFHGWSGTSITIPDSVKGIGEEAFYYCSNLTSITFQGTKAQWNAISKGSRWNYNTGSYTVHCTDGDIAE